MILPNFAQINKEEAEFLVENLINLPDGSVIVELGTYKGGSAFVMSEVYKRGKIFSIDHYEDCTVEEVKNNLVGHDVELLNGKTSDLAKTWSLPIDFLFIDASHYYEDVMEDIKNWLPKVKDKGLIMFNDYDSWPGVTMAVHRAIEKKWIEPLSKAGSMLLTRKNNEI